MPGDLHPLVFEPVYKDYIWSGARLAKRYSRAVPNGRCAESWEVADRHEGMSVVKSGPLAGARLDELVTRFGRSLVGNPWNGGPFPLLVKIIDAGEKLSVQVHPDDANAERTGGEPKTEMWYALDAARDAALYLGFSAGVTRKSFAAALADNSVEPLLMKHRVSAGDAFYVPGGAVHAIGAGCLLLEVQQNSNTTYRVYDWGRVDAKTGRPRELHVENALKVIRWTAPAPQPIRHRTSECGSAPHRMLESPYFVLDRYDISKPLALNRNSASFDILFAADGAVRVTAGSRYADLQAGTSCLVPAALPDCRIEPAGQATLLRIAMPAR
jgi:mannose-6-phosphate isomerase